MPFSGAAVCSVEKIVKERKCIESNASIMLLESADDRCGSEQGFLSSIHGVQFRGS